MKRVILNVSDSLHSSLKQRAAREGVPMSALCARLLEESEEREPETQTLDLFEPMLYATLPLNLLRDELEKLAKTQMQNSEKRSRMLKINHEMARRYRR